MVRLPPRLRPLFPVIKPVYIRTTRAVTPSMRALSRWRRSWVPTGFVDSLDEAAAATGGVCRLARPAETAARSHPMTGWPPGLPFSARNDGDSVRRVLAAELPGGRVLGKHRAVVTSRGQLVDEVSRYFGTRRAAEHPVLLNPFPPPPFDVAGRLGVLAARGDYNYYHFLVDVLPRLGILEQAGLREGIEQWYVPATSAFQREALQLVGVPSTQIVDADEHPHVRAELLVVPGLVAMTEKNPPWVVQFLRERLMRAAEVEPVDHPKRLIWITRGASPHNRMVRNEAEVVDWLSRRGFEPVDPGRLSVAEQARTFSEAAVIVSAHGAALTNLVFASPGSAVIEIFPSGTLLPDYWRLAAGVPGLQYRYLSGPRVWTHPSGPNSLVIRDIVVDLERLKTLLAEVGAH